MLPAVFTPHLVLIVCLANHHIIRKFSCMLLWSHVSPVHSWLPCRGMNAPACDAGTSVSKGNPAAALGGIDVGKEIKSEGWT